MINKLLEKVLTHYCGYLIVVLQLLGSDEANLPM